VNASPVLTDGHRKLYAVLADLLIPGQDGILSATQAEVHDAHIDQALTFRPDLINDFLHALHHAESLEPRVAIETLATQHNRAFHALTLLTAGAYFLNPQVRQNVYKGREAPKAATEDLDTYVDMLESVVGRGPIFRSA
jgi:hypothetical protein